MKLVNEIPDEIVSLIVESDGKIGRDSLKDMMGISEHEARYYLRLWRDKIGDSSPQSLGMAQILQDKLKEQTKIIKSQQRELAVEEIILGRMKEIIPMLPLPKKLPVIPQKDDKIDVREVVTVWTDWHAAEVVDLEQMEGRNEYNLDIMYGRIWNLLRGTIRIIDSQREKFEITTLNIDMLGDMLSGSIHDELKETNQFPILKATLATAFVAAQAISMLVPHFNLIRITCCVGNHARLTKKPAFKNKVLDSYDYMFYQLVSIHLHKYIEEGKIEFNIPESPECIIVRSGFSFLLGHSDQIRSYLGLPFYGFARDDANQQRMRKLRSVISTNADIKSAEDLEGAIINFENARSVYGYDYREAGHFHTMAIINDWSTMLCPSLVGENEYSKNKLRVRSRPMQLLAFLSARWGIKGIEPINCKNEPHNFSIYSEGVLGEMISCI